MELSGMDMWAFDLLELYEEVQQMDEAMEELDLELLDEKASGWMWPFY